MEAATRDGIECLPLFLTHVQPIGMALHGTVSGAGERGPIRPRARATHRPDRVLTTVLLSRCKITCSGFVRSRA
jgi:hypothetical protein